MKAPRRSHTIAVGSVYATLDDSSVKSRIRLVPTGGPLQRTRPQIPQLISLDRSTNEELLSTAAGSSNGFSTPNRLDSQPPIINQIFELHHPIQPTVHILRHILMRSPLPSNIFPSGVPRFCYDYGMTLEALQRNRGLRSHVGFNICFLGESTLKDELVALLVPKKKRRLLSLSPFVRFHQVERCGPNENPPSYIYTNHLYEMTLCIQLTSRPLTKTDLLLKKACRRYKIPLAFVNLLEDPPLEEALRGTMIRKRSSTIKFGSCIESEETLYTRVTELKKFFLYLSDDSDVTRFYFVHLPTIKAAVDDPDVTAMYEESSFLLWVAQCCGRSLMANLRRPSGSLSPRIMESTTQQQDFVVSFVGEQFVGRSTIVNALLGVPAMNLEADRPSSTGRERKFRHPFYQTLVLRDLPARGGDPAVGTPEAYIHKYGLDKSDLNVLIFTGRCREPDAALACALRDQSTSRGSVVLVRTKCDLMLDDMLQQDPALNGSDQGALVLLHQLRATMVKNLALFGLSTIPCYILSGLYLSRFLTSSRYTPPFDEVRFIEDCKSRERMYPIPPSSQIPPPTFPHTPAPPTCLQANSDTSHH
eukprot:Blabericola_migrator_1__1399@NODE_1364_length_4709_cov_70_595648_g916_i0_p1_GENE_NODE_1364_length_4709_cov_70_595648_g916_i0NODE_1364_length_4709_cov_70_595648_g916_i0_p1_ORF_typecomplete_len589_score65_72IIGP/PF05049_13/0_011IIGP/PF05049_13/1_7e16RsgA_GTPase/PF03193_16/0_15RsgA_GTPase/PF03193_16/5_1e02MMR_HSR1/PF01926_23/0_15_NODE_1364_length_4709_cov_70_595648_g916_i04262192